MGVVHFLICGVLQHNILEKEVALKTTSADVTAVLRRNDSKKKRFHRKLMRHIVGTPTFLHDV